MDSPSPGLPSQVKAYVPRSADRFTGRWSHYVARAGFAAKGIVYIVVGVLALQVAIGVGGETTGTRGAIAAIAQQPFGQVLLWAMGIGLFAYMAWRFTQAVLDPEDDEEGAKKAVKRVAYFISGVIHAGLATAAIHFAMGAGDRSGGQGSQQVTAQVLAQPFGQWLVGLAGVAVIIVGCAQFGAAYTASFMDRTRPSMTASQRKWTQRAGRWGHAARGVVFGIAGWFVIQAALQADPSQARGLDGALEELSRQPYGPWLLGVVAAGLALYGLFMIIMARFRRINA